MARWMMTMAAMLGSELTILGQFGSTVCIGLLLDTLVVRTLLMPSIATMLGRWFWWPQIVRPRPASFMLRSSGPRPLVRAYLLPPPAEAEPEAELRGRHGMRDLEPRDRGCLQDHTEGRCRRHGMRWK